MMSIERFRKVFSVIPESEKKKPILVIGNRIITWEEAFKEISSKTKLGEKIQKNMEELDII